MVLEYLPTFARTKSPSHVGKYTIHGAYGIFTTSFAWLRHVVRSVLRVAEAIPAVNCVSSSSINACIEAARKMDAPVMIQRLGGWLVLLWVGEMYGKCMGNLEI